MNITSFLDTSDNLSLLLACKTINKDLSTYGYVTNLTLTNDITYYEKIKKTKGKPSIVNMKGFRDPLVWLPFFPDKIVLSDCEEQYENILVFCMSNNYEIFTHKDNLIILIRSPTQPRTQDI